MWWIRYKDLRLRIADLQITLNFHFIILVRNLEPARRVGFQVKRGEKIAALKARSSNPMASCQRLESG
jgi:hypothetical protein